MDGQTDLVKPVSPPYNFVAGGYNYHMFTQECTTYFLIPECTGTTYFMTRRMHNLFFKLKNVQSVF